MSAATLTAAEAGCPFCKLVMERVTTGRGIEQIGSSGVYHFEPLNPVTLIAKLREAETVIANVEDFVTRHYLDMRMGQAVLALTDAYKPTNQEGDVVPEYEYAFRADAEFIATFDPPTVLALIARLREAETARQVEHQQKNRARNERNATQAKLREAEAKLPPCDGGCSYDSGPDETCSAHGRPPAEIWEIVASVAAERDAAQGQLGEAEAVIENTSHIHGPRKVWESDRAYTLVCTVCITEPYPCATVLTLSRHKPTNQEGDTER